MEGFDEIAHYLLNLGDKRADAFVLRFDDFVHKIWKLHIGRVMNKTLQLSIDNEIEKFLQEMNYLGLPKPLITVEWKPMYNTFKLDLKADKNHWSRWMFDSEYESDRYPNGKDA